jgi:hypothetical protein
LIRTDFAGALTYKFCDEKAGFYDIYITYYDENDGAATFSVSKGWRVLDMWKADERTPGDLACKDTRVIRVIKNIKLGQGEKILISGKKNCSEYARIDCIEFIDSGRSYYVPDKDSLVTIEAEDIIKRNFSVQDVQDASKRKIVLADRAGKGEVVYKSTLEPGFYEIQINYFDLNNGNPNYILFCNGKPLAKWNADKKTSSDSFCEATKETFIVSGVYIPKQAEIAVSGISNHHEKANLDAIVFKPSFNIRDNASSHQSNEHGHDYGNNHRKGGKK